MAHTYEVFVDDNFHFMAEDERYKLGEYATLADAIAAGKNMVDEDLARLALEAKAQGHDGDLYEYYTSFGSDPFIRTDGPEAGQVLFSAWDYAKEQCEKKQPEKQAEKPLMDAPTAAAALAKGVRYSFIPARLELAGRSEFSVFPFNVFFANYTVKDGQTIMGSALYEPDFHTYKKEANFSVMRYHNIYGGDAHLMVVYDQKNKRYRGEKFVNGKSVGSADGGPNWQMFFLHFTALGLADGEHCKFKPVDEAA